MRKYKNSQAGFTLVEISIVLLILGMITGAAFAFLTPALDLKYRETTRQKQEKIVRALANYAQQRGMLPCPGRPEAVPLGEASASCTSISSRNGIVPFRELGLSQDDAIDGWGRPFSYTVDGRTQSPDITAIHEICRLRGDNVILNWIGFVGNDVLYPQKSHLCCQRNIGTDRLQIFMDWPTVNLAAQVQSPLVIPSGTFSNDDVAVVVPTPPGSTLNYFSYALISHGKNGQGSFAFGQTSRVQMPAIGTPERENANDTDAVFVALPPNLQSGVNYFDDMVVWRLSQQLISEFGNDSCVVPR